MTTFDPKLHEYRVDGRRVPSVTQVLGGGSKWYTQEASDRGTAVHKAIADAEREGESWEDWLAGPPGLAPYLAAYRQFRKLTKWIPCEMDSLITGKLDGYIYAGQFDAIGTMMTPDGEEPVLIDWKTGAPCPEHFPQVAAYGAAIDWPGRLAVVYLAKGRPDVRLLKSLDETRALMEFRRKLAFTWETWPDDRV